MLLHAEDIFSQISRKFYTELFGFGLVSKYQKAFYACNWFKIDLKTLIKLALVSQIRSIRYANF